MRASGLGHVGSYPMHLHLHRLPTSSGPSYSRSLLSAFLLGAWGHILETAPVHSVIAFSFVDVTNQLTSRQQALPHADPHMRMHARHCLIQLRVQQPAREPGQEQPRKDEAQLSIAVKDGPGHMSQRGTAEAAPGHTKLHCLQSCWLLHCIYSKRPAPAAAPKHSLLFIVAAAGTGQCDTYLGSSHQRCRRCDCMQGSNQQRYSRACRLPFAGSVGLHLAEQTVQSSTWAMFWISAAATSAEGTATACKARGSSAVGTGPVRTQVPLLPSSQIICQAALPVRRCLQLRLAQPACCVKQAPLLESARAASSKTHVTRHRPCTWLAWSSCVQQPRVLSLGDSILGREVAADEPPQKFKIVSERRLHTREPIPRAAMLAQPLHNAEVAMSGSCTAGSWNPFTAILPRMCLNPSHSRSGGHTAALPGTAVLVGILQHCQVASSSCSCTDSLIPVTALLPCPLQHCQVGPSCRSRARAWVPGTAVLARPFQYRAAAAQNLIKWVSLRLQELQIPSIGSFEAPAVAHMK
eukprot:jgi/Astpho2/10022/fgenesh1_pg.00153_%23_33_t